MNTEGPLLTSSLLVEDLPCSSRVKFSNFYLLIGWKIKSYFGNSENFWPYGLHKGHKAKKGQKMKFCQMNQNSLIHGEN